jgi:hypothetical protein
MTLTISTAPAIAKPSGPSVSAPVGKLLQPAQKLLEAKDYAGAMTLIKQAQAVSPQTDYDTYAINNFLANAALGLNDMTTADTAFEAMADSPAMPDGDKSTTLHNAALLANQAKHYDKAIKYGTAFLALGTPDATVTAAVAQAYYFSGDYANATAWAQKAIDAAPAGQPPNQGALEIKLQAQIKAKQETAAAETLEQLVSYYNDPDDWGQVIDFATGLKGIKDIEALHVYRLRLAAHANGQEDSYTIPAQIASTLHYPVEAEAFLNAGIAAGKVDRGNPLIKTIHASAAADRQALAPLASLAAKAGTGELSLNLAETYYGYARYAEAEAAARAALQKGGPKVNVTEANMVLAEALLAEGKKADAITAFKGVSNPSPGFAKAQHIWLTYANAPYNTASAQ